MEYVVEIAKKAEEFSEIVAIKLKEFFQRDRVTVAIHCGNTEGLAIYLSSVLRIAKPDINIAVLDGDYGYNIVIPYIAEDISSVILLSSAVGTRCMYRVLQALSTIGIETLSIAPIITASNVKEHLARWGQRLEFLEINENIFRLTLLQAFLRLALEIGGRDVARIRRIKGELSLSNIVKELIDRYPIPVDINRGMVMITKSLLPAGEELMDKGIPVLVLGKHMSEEKLPTLIVCTSVEEHIVNEYMVEIMRKIGGVKIPIIKLNVDPLTAPIYALILFHAKML